MYDKRRYKVENGRLLKEWHSKDDEGWKRTKQEAWDAAERAQRIRENKPWEKKKAQAKKAQAKKAQAKKAQAKRPE